jgi:NADPH:quinone reductase-like Zn-dependent oxidoreductase
MKAITFNHHGGPEVLEYNDVPTPAINATEVLVQVRACAINHLDIWARKGLPGIEIPLPHILGNDIAGVVCEVGNLVDWVKTGDEVMLHPGVSCGHCYQCLNGQDNLCPTYKILGYQLNGGYAEFVAAPAVNVIPKPATISWHEAAALPLVTVTAWHMLVTRANIQPGEDVLIHAAGSGVGSIGIQIAKLRGARVIATAGSNEKLAKALELGADEAVNYSNPEWPKEIRRLTGKAGVDIVFEHTGAATWPGSIRSLKPNGRLVTCGATSGYDASTDLRQVFYRHLNLLGSFMGTKSGMLDSMKFIENRKLRAVIDRVLPLEQAASAHTLIEDRAQFGKLVLQP